MNFNKKLQLAFAMLLWSAIVTPEASAAVAADVPHITYQVPVKDSSLLPYATYDVSDKDRPYEPNTESVMFWLPPELTGNDLPFHFLVGGADGNWVGGGVHGKCSYVEPDFKCDMQFDKQEWDLVDTNKVRSNLEAISTDFHFIEKKIAVSTIFSGELHGILSIRIPRAQRAAFRARFNK